MKKALLLLLLAAPFSIGAQISTKITGNIFNAKSDSIYLSQVVNNKIVDHFGGVIQKDGNFALEGELPLMDYYMLRIDKDYINLILRDKSDIQVYGDGSNLMNFVNIIGSAESSNMFKFYQETGIWNQKNAEAMQTIKNNPEKKPEVDQRMKQEQTKYQAQLKTFIARNPNSPALIAAVTQIDVNADFVTFESVVNQLIRVFGQSPTVEQLNKEYQQIRAQVHANDKLAPGKPAPDFEELMPDGSTMKLSDLKGKVVLLDFWASWCGPCRRENPNVVALYERYKDKGFTVMSVSLDKDRKRWLDAIEKDNLTWPYHVSDLKFWQAKAAKLYGVSGIPFTVLIDQEGNIIRTKLRGEELAMELKRLLGS